MDDTVATKQRIAELEHAIEAARASGARSGEVKRLRGVLDAEYEKVWSGPTWREEITATGLEADPYWTERSPKSFNEGRRTGRHDVELYGDPPQGFYTNQGCQSVDSFLAGDPSRMAGSRLHGYVVAVVDSLYPVSLRKHVQDTLAVANEKLAEASVPS